MPPQALEDDDLLEDILLRLPPHPSSLLCKRWCRLIRDAQFIRRFHAHHRSPPLLGFFLLSGQFIPVNEHPYRDPTAPSSLSPLVGQTDVFTWRVLGCRHGLVLTEALEEFRLEFTVLEPMTSDLCRTVITKQAKLVVAATVVAVADGTSTGCRSFRLIVLFSHYGSTRLTASVYSSDSGNWVHSVAALCLVSSIVAFIRHPSTLVGNAIYWLVPDGRTILRFDLETQSLSVIEQPPYAVGRRRHAVPLFDHSRWIVPAVDGYIGLAILSEDLSIKFWERETEVSSAGTWLLRRTVQLDRVLSGLELNEQRLPLRIIGFAEENDVIFISSDDYVFMLHIESMQFKKVKIAIGYYIHPYSSF